MTRLNKACCAEDGVTVLVAVETMKDTELASPQADAAHAEDQFIALERTLIAGDQAQGHYFLFCRALGSGCLIMRDRAIAQRRCVRAIATDGRRPPPKRQRRVCPFLLAPTVEIDTGDDEHSE